MNTSLLSRLLCPFSGQPLHLQVSQGFPPPASADDHPDVEAAFLALPKMLKPGGALVVDFDRKSWRSLLLPNYWLRPVTKYIPKNTLFSLLETAVPVMLLISNALAAVPVLGQLLRRLVPVANYTGMLPLSKQQIREWALLDTFDWLSPAYDNPQIPKTVWRWLQTAGLQQVEVLHAGHLVGRGRLP